ncbi:MAG: hypothetical protein M1838_003708 [Thelocarpon superellum]|nr:MAG: hypothetical protein M1838_003708 [Thelocarpon superellum]
MCMTGQAHACVPAEYLDLVWLSRALMVGQQEYDQFCVQIVQELSSKISRVSSPDPQADVSIDDSPLPVGITLGPYHQALHHADGLFSTVYKASDAAGHVVALKVTTPAAMAPPHNAAREARILRTTSDPHVITLMETFNLAGGRFALVFPFMPYDLEQVLQQHLVSTSQVISHLYDLFSALEHLHSQGMIHRDIKPANLLLRSPSGPAFLADFGIAWSPHDAESEAAASKITDVGTTSYRPPELLFGHAAYDTTLDLWAAGCVAAEALGPTHRPLFDSGPLGSELALIQSIFGALGTPTLDEWPEAARFPDWGKMQFHPFPPRPWSVLLPDATDDARDLVRRLVRYESSSRMTAAEVSA